MQGDPQRPYAQLLTPAAKSQKLLLRLQHKKLTGPEQIRRAQLVFRVWQAFLQKNIPSTLWPSFCDLMMFLDGQYLPVLIAPFGQLDAVRLAYSERTIDGYLLLNALQDFPLSVTSAGEALVGMQLLDRLGRKGWLAASKPLIRWQIALVESVAPKDADTALDLLRLIGTQAACPWHDCPDSLPEMLLAEIYFRIWRAQGGLVTVSRLGDHPLVGDAADYLAASVPAVACEDGSYRFRSQG